MASSPQPTAESLFVEWLARREAGEEADLEELCRRHPELAERLRVLHGHHEELEALKLHLSLEGSVAERLSMRFGPGVDPKVQLEREEPGDAASALAGRLAGGGAGRYRVKGEVAKGGMGTILRVWDEDLRRHLAMKVVLDKREGPAGAGVSFLARFIEEAQVTGQLDHPNIVPVHELGLDERGRAYFTMKLVKGQELKSVFEHARAGREGWNQVKVLGVLLKVCEAMSYAHDKGVLHRDLKPGNVMVGRYGEVYVMDWGLAKVLGRADDKDIRVRQGAPDVPEGDDGVSRTPEALLYTMDGDIVGTPAYMPPEQAEGRREDMGPQSDVYAVGAMLYHLLAGHIPYVPRGEKASHPSVWRRVKEGPPAPLALVAPGAPAELVAICEKAMARERAERYGDMASLAADLSAYLEGRVVAAYETGTWAETRKWVQRNRPLAASLAAAVVLLVLGLSASLVFKARADVRAGELFLANTTITQRSLDLAAATAAARENEQRALDQERVATLRANDVLSLSAIQELKDLEDEAQALWPPHPEMLPRYEEWLRRAAALIEGRPEEPERGIKARPSLAEHEENLAALRLRAKPLTREDVEADRRASPGYDSWRRRRDRLGWMRRMLGEEPWTDEAQAEAQLAQESLPVRAQALNELAWPMVDPDPDNARWGDEARALLLAQRALAVAGEVEVASIRDTTAWALARLGRFDEALQEQRVALELCQERQRPIYIEHLAQIEALASDWTGPQALAARREEARELERELDSEAEALPRRTFAFEDTEDHWWHLQLSNLVAGLEAFRSEQGLYSSGTPAGHGWGIPVRAEFARTIRARSVDGLEARRLWDEAIAAVAASPRYGGLRLTPQLGLLPLGADPHSQLFEFAHLQTGEPPARDARGKLVLREESAVVLVLLPGGTFAMGASVEEGEENHDPLARPTESPVHAVTLSPFFLSKYELTQAQWLRVTGENPSVYPPPDHVPTLLHPVEKVSWHDCRTWTARLGLALPSEAQWEYGARGGTDTPWWTGAEPGSLAGKVNLAKRKATPGAEGSAPAAEDGSELEDPDLLHAEVGSYPPNPFGLHEVAGNLWEWCADGYDPNYYLRSPARDPLAPLDSSEYMVARGGGHISSAASVRSAIRGVQWPSSSTDAIGLRPARRLDP